ncbi:hypothetical protein DAPPUDRAFT_327671 [Daphnia pulex]|uniref:SWIM-type domain-containing protein n=1 Tax=Daphnia pulex TaxID=6669 RepID=E9HBD7_DAPPU|nr:hypothetical protein DAPPUDRAFT_327671 [Daphnia pulex]|eukprot:EFX70946.1 hypothetical protein DAPPUDRAFT_327671 [Daphnia pulex]
MATKSQRQVAAERVVRLCEKLMTTDPVFNVKTNPSAGVEYVYEPAADQKVKDDWRADGWHWRQNASYNHIVNGLIVGTKVKLKNTATATPKRRKKKNENFIPTRNSTKEKLKNSTGCPINVYREQLADGPADLKEKAVQLPRDVEQVRNFQKNQKRKIALTQDTNYNLQEIADDTKFIKEIITYPDVAIYMFHPQLWELFKGLLNRKDLPFLSLSVDTTFEMTDEYVTALVARFEEFNEGPVFSLATMIHERKFSETHRFFWQKVTQFLPQLVTASNIYIVSDEEAAIVGAIKEYMPHTDAYLCWNHIVTNAKLKLKRLNITADNEVAKYVDDIYYLLGQEDEKDNYKELSVINADPDRWHTGFKKYFMDNIDSKVDKADRPIDVLCVAFYRLAKTFVMEFIRGRYRKGNYTIRAHIAHLYNLRENPPDPAMLERVEKEQEIFDRLRNVREERRKLLAEAQINQGAEKEYIEDHEFTTWERAQHVVANELIKLDVKTYTFIVIGSAENRLVTLCPKITCTCPATTVCYHILAAHIAIGDFQPSDTKRPKNSTRYRKRAKKNADKRSGNKAPRKLDVDRPTVTSSPVSSKRKKLISRNITRNGAHQSHSSESDSPDLSFPSDSDDDLHDLQNSSPPLDQHYDTNDNMSLVSTESPKKIIGAQVVTNSMLEEILSIEDTVTLTVDKMPLNEIYVPESFLDLSTGTTVAIVHREDNLEEESSIAASISSIPNINPEIQFLDATLAISSESDYRQTWQLTADEINEIKRSTKLTTRHINSLLALIRKKYPQIGGLFNVHHATSTGTYPVPTEKLWMQIIHTGKCHWVLAVSGFPVCRDNDVAVYDSIGFERGSEEETVKAISSLLGRPNYNLIAPS